MIKIKKISLLILIIFNLNILYSIDKKTIEYNLKKIINQKKYEYKNQEINIDKDKNDKSLKLLKNFLYVFANFLRKISSLSAGKILIIILSIIILVFLLIYIINQINFRYIKKHNKLSSDKQNAIILNLNYQVDLEKAKKLIMLKRYKEAISISLNALWLYFNYKKYISYDKSRTNREYLKFIEALTNFKIIRNLVYDAEKAVYFEDNIDEKKCSKIFDDVTKLVAQ